uniref:Uncharacterized protein n=1 Tax=Romanomermis culicivorax TaxID=13658 RepID=A0A915HWM9_ROMCU
MQISYMLLKRDKRWTYEEALENRDEQFVVSQQKEERCTWTKGCLLTNVTYSRGRLINKDLRYM